MNNNPNPIVIPINKATGSCFDTRNDDLIIIDSYRLLRATTRPQRFTTTTTTNRKPKFNIKLDFGIVEAGYETDTVILIKMMNDINEELKLNINNLDIRTK